MHRLQNPDLHPFLRGIRLPWMQAIISCSVPSTFSPGDYLFRTGERATRMFLVNSGHVSVELDHEDSPPTLVGLVGAGDLIAGPCPSKARYWRFNARCQEEVKTQSIILNRLQKICHENHELACELNRRLIDVLLDQLDATRRQLAEVSQLAFESQRRALNTFCSVPSVDPDPN